MKRLFIGTFIDDGVLNDKIHSIKDDFDEYVEGKWVEPDNLHFTFSFIGNVPDENVAKIQEELGDVLTKYRSSLQFAGLGAFPNIERPKIIFAKMYNPTAVIFKIKNEIDKKLAKIDILDDRQRFKPHITLCRTKKIIESPANIFKDYSSKEFGEMPNFTVNLVESKLTSKGPVYNIL